MGLCIDLCQFIIPAVLSRSLSLAGCELLTRCETMVLSREQLHLSACCSKRSELLFSWFSARPSPFIPACFENQSADSLSCFSGAIHHGVTPASVSARASALCATVRHAASADVEVSALHLLHEAAASLTGRSTRGSRCCFTKVEQVSRLWRD